jgi:GMP synthase-like glutamine amidotransferase
MENDTMRMHYLQHETFEDPGTILEWAARRGHSTSSTLIFKGEPFPSPETFDMLVIMGGSMSVREKETYPWLPSEVRFIRSVIDKNKTVLGICLGAQLIANALGAKVYRHSCKEIGWFDVTLSKDGAASGIFRSLPRVFPAMHWHGDTFDLPAGAVHCAFSKACQNQAFAYGANTVGLQFHVEYTAENRAAMIENCGSDLHEQGPYVQSPDYIISQDALFPALKELNFRLLNAMAARYRKNFS